MPFTVITLTNVPKSLRGELTKWMQEIAVGVYVGNFNSRIREQLWKHVCDNVNDGEATISYSTRNEIGYTFESYQTQQEVFELDGIPLVRYPIRRRDKTVQEKHGFSNAYKSHMRLKTENKDNKETKEKGKIPAYVIIDLETTGLDEEKNQIIEIGAIKINGKHKEEFQRLLLTDGPIPKFITELTGISNQMIAEKGSDRRESIKEFANFIGELPVVGYNVNFDIKFLEKEFQKQEIIWKPKYHIDILAIVKREKMFLGSYKLLSVLKSYGIDDEVTHRSLEDVKLLDLLISKLNGFEVEIKRKG